MDILVTGARLGRASQLPESIDSGTRLGIVRRNGDCCPEKRRELIGCALPEHREKHDTRVASEAPDAGFLLLTLRVDPSAKLRDVKLP